MTIPYVLYKTGPFDTVTQPEIVECFQINEKMLKSKIVYFNDRACKNFIKQHFGPNIIKAYDMLIPGAYKADLWRLCVLYIHGGIYGDLTQTFLREYNVNKDNADIILVRDTCESKYGIYNAFMAAKKRNGFLQYCIEQIVKQILMKDKRKNYLDITGPRALKRHYLTFFHVNRIKTGLQRLRGLDNKIYRINVPFRHAETGMCKKHRHAACCLELNHTCIFLRKIKNHNKLLYNVKNIHYSELYKQNKIFKRSKYGGAANGSLQTHQRQKFHFYFSRLK